MTDTPLTERERAFRDEVFDRMRSGKFGKKRRLEMMAAAGADQVLSEAERVRFERAGKLPPRLLEGAPLTPADAGDYAVLGLRSTDWSLALSPPVQHSAGPLPIEEFSRAGVRRFPDLFAVEARNVRAHLKNHLSIVEAASGYVPEITDEDALPYASTFPWEEVRELEGKTANLFATGSAMFSHWTFDVLPRVKMLAERGHPIESFDHVVIAARNPGFGFHAQGLAAVGIDPGKVFVAAEGRPVFSFEHLVQPSKCRVGYYGEPWVYEEVRRLFAGGRLDGAGPGERLFIGRKNTNKRTVLNYAEIEPVLAAAGFSTVYAEDFSIAEFAQVLNKARAIVAVHGAGLSNIVFCEPGTRLMELYGPHITYEFWGIANTLGLDHHILAGYDDQGRYPWEAGAFPVASQKERNAAGFFVDPAQLRRALADFCEGL
jgi:capsular polysaccharide biosynthesis protein